MSLSLIIYYCSYFLFSPIAFIVYIFAVFPVLEKLKITSSVDMGGNVSRLHLIPILISVVLVSGLFMLFSFLFLSSIKEMSLNTFLQPKNQNLQIACFVITAFVIYFFTSSKGMEGNIAGFIFFPILVVTSITLIVLHLIWIWNVVIKG